MHEIQKYNNKILTFNLLYVSKGVCAKVNQNPFHLFIYINHNFPEGLQKIMGLF